jgi:small subunit ribosomal protein S7
MARRRKPEKREILPDPKFQSKKLAKFVNTLMLDGKKSVAEKIIYGALDIVSDKRKQDPLEAFDKVMENIGPVVEVRSRRVGGATYQVPAPVRPERQEALAMRWLIEASRKRSEKGMRLRLAAEMSEAYEGRGSAVKKKEDVYRMAEANKAFSHFRW